MVIEERDLVFPSTAKPNQRDIYRRYYSVYRLRLLSEHRYLADPRRHDLWLALLATFQLFEADGPGEKLGVAPLAGDLFGHDAIGLFATAFSATTSCSAAFVPSASTNTRKSRQLIRVNYAALNVEEFGSVYEGLLEIQAVL